MCYDVGRTATVEQLSQAIRRYIGAAVDWIDALFSLANLTDYIEKVGEYYFEYHLLSTKLKDSRILKQAIVRPKSFKMRVIRILLLSRGWRDKLINIRTSGGSRVLS